MFICISIHKRILVVLMSVALLNFVLCNAVKLLLLWCHLWNDRVATSLENLEYSGISLNVENSGNSVQPQGKIVTNRKYFQFIIQISV